MITLPQFYATLLEFAIFARQALPSVHLTLIFKVLVTVVLLQILEVAIHAHVSIQQ